MNESNPSDAALAELLTLTVEVDGNGSRFHYNHLGQLHRVHGPAAIWSDGDNWWYQADEPHRIDGPAFQRVSGEHGWFIYGEKLTEEQWNERIKSI